MLGLMIFLCHHIEQVGFNEDNIRALCNVGDSTKQNKQGYIGQKGIGFKSVFRVTDKPSIHSRGFHIAFDIKADHGKLNFILPTWVGEQHLYDTASSCPEVETQLRSPEWRTIIHLPTKPPGNQAIGQSHVVHDFEE